MSEETLVENQPAIQVLEPSADVFAGGVVSAYVKANENERINFLVRFNGTDAATAQATLKVKAATDNLGAGATDIPFQLSKTKDSPADLYEETADVAATGQATDLNKDRTYVLSVDTDALPAGQIWLAAALDETVAGAVSGHAMMVGSGSRYKGTNKNSLL